MAFELLKTDYVDATFEGLRRYLVSDNGDGSVSLHDVTKYKVKEESFFGAKDANTINTAVNAILAALENGTDLYEVFTQFFELQKTLFLEESDAKQVDFTAYIMQLREYMDRKWDELKTEYTGDIQYFKDVQENAFKVWFQMVRDQLTNDVAGHLQEQIGNLNNLKTENKEDLVSAINSIMLSYDETRAVLGGVHTLNVTLVSKEGESVSGVTVTLHNSESGRNVIKEYIGEEISFEVYGDAEYQISASDMGEYIIPAKKLYITDDVNLNLQYKLASLNDLTWEEISYISESGRAAQLFKIGETKDFTLDTGEQCKAVIMDFNHDPLASDSSKTAGITFGMLNCLSEGYSMNSVSTNEGGYDGSIMFRTVMEVFYDEIPSDMKPHIKKVRKKASAGSKSSQIKSFDVFAFLLAEIEVFNATNRSVVGEGTFYPYFATEENRIKNKGANGIFCYWFLRSPSRESDYCFCGVNYRGNVYEPNAIEYNGLSAGFCV